MIMQKFMIASDIHGSADWCERLVEIAREEKAKLFLLGDLLYHGPRNPFPDGYNPQKVFEMLNAEKENILCVRGNCDSEVDQMVLEFPIRADYAQVDLDGHTLFLTHGHLFNKEILKRFLENFLRLRLAKLVTVLVLFYKRRSSL